MSAKNGEKKIFVSHVNIRQSIFLLLVKLFLLDLIFALLFLGFFLFLSLNSLSNEVRFQFIAYSKVYFILLVLAKIFLTIFAVLQWLNEYYEIRPDLVSHRRGIIWRKEEKYPMQQIRAVGIQQGTLGRIFQYGTLTLYDWWMEKYAVLYLVHNPLKYLHILENLVPRASQEKDILREKIIEEEETIEDKIEKELE